MALNNFFMIVGGQKCATTSMHHWLDQHPDICMSVPKEPKFFEIDYWKGAKWYEDNHYYHNCKLDMKFYGEARVQNILIKYVPDRIMEYNPNTKIVIMIRNPVDRFISAWNHFKTMRPGREIRSLERTVYEAIDNFDLNCFDSEEKFYANLDPKGGPYGGRYLEHGMYADHIERFNDMFDTRIIVVDDLINNQQYEYNDLLKFIGAKSFTPDFKNKNIKKSVTNDSRSIETLRKFYRNSVERLSVGLNRNLTKEWGFDND